MAIPNVVAVPLTQSAVMPIPNRSEALGTRQFEVLLVESLLKTMRLNASESTAQGTIGNVWDGVLKTYLAQAIVNQKDLESGYQVLQKAR